MSEMTSKLSGSNNGINIKQNVEIEPGVESILDEEQDQRVRYVMGLEYQKFSPLNNRIALGKNGAISLSHKLEPILPEDPAQVDPNQVDPPLNNPKKKPSGPKFACNLEGYLGGQSIKPYYVISNFQNAVEHFSMIIIIGLLMVGIYLYHPLLPGNGRIYFLLIFVVLIAKSVLSLFDVIFILCFNHEKRETWIILLSVLTHISFYCFQFLAANEIILVRSNIGIINTIYFVVYLIEAIVGKCTEPDAPAMTYLDPKQIRVSAIDYYCYAALAGYTVESLCMMKVLGAIDWNWMFVLFPVVLIFFVLVFLIFFYFFWILFGLLQHRAGWG